MHTSSMSARVICQPGLCMHCCLALLPQRIMHAPSNAVSKLLSRPCMGALLLLAYEVPQQPCQQSLTPYCPPPTPTPTPGPSSASTSGCLLHCSFDVQPDTHSNAPTWLSIPYGGATPYPKPATSLGASQYPDCRANQLALLQKLVQCAKDRVCIHKGVNYKNTSLPQTDAHIHSTTSVHSRTEVTSRYQHCWRSDLPPAHHNHTHMYCLPTNSRH